MKKKTHFHFHYQQQFSQSKTTDTILYYSHHPNGSFSCNNSQHIFSVDSSFERKEVDTKVWNSTLEHTLIMNKQSTLSYTFGPPSKFYPAVPGFNRRICSSFRIVWEGKGAEFHMLLRHMEVTLYLLNVLQHRKAKSYCFGILPVPVTQNTELEMVKEGLPRSPCPLWLALRQTDKLEREFRSTHSNLNPTPFQLLNSII